MASESAPSVAPTAVPTGTTTIVPDTTTANKLAPKKTRTTFRETASALATVTSPDELKKSTAKKSDTRSGVSSAQFSVDTVSTTSSTTESKSKERKRTNNNKDKVTKSNSGSGRGSGGGRWMDALLSYVRNPGRYRNEIVDIDDDTVTVIDGYPKAAHHWLVLPRKHMKLNHVSELTRTHLPLLHHMVARARHVIATQQARDHTAFTYQIGFHAVPSMKLLHMHVISHDFDSNKLKKRQHWCSFTTPFFMMVEYVINQLETHGRIVIDERAYEKLLKGHFDCHRCDASFDNLSSLKQHIIACALPPRPIDNDAFARTLIGPPPIVSTAPQPPAAVSLTTSIIPASTATAATATV